MAISSNAIVRSFVILTAIALAIFLASWPIYLISDILLERPIDLRPTQFLEYFQITTGIVIQALLEISETIFLLGLLFIVIPVAILFVRMKIASEAVSDAAYGINQFALSRIIEKGRIVGFDFDQADQDPADDGNGGGGGGGLLPREIKKT